jgi:hypothetical protein
LARRRLAHLCALGAALLAGCGGAHSGNAGTTPATDPDVAYYNRLVATVNAYIRAHQAGTVTGAGTAPSTREEDALRKARATVATLRAPSDLAADQRAIESIFERKLALLPRELSAYGVHDPEALSTLLDADQRLTEELMRTVAKVRRVVAGSR